MGRYLVNTMLGLTAVTTCLWLIPLMCPHWHEKRIWVMTPPMYVDVKISLIDVIFDANCPKHSKIGWFCEKLVDLWEGPKVQRYTPPDGLFQDKFTGNNLVGTRSLEHFRDDACNFHQTFGQFLGTCDAMVRIQVLGLVNLLVISIHIVLTVTASGFLAYYWYKSPKRLYRKLFMALYCVSPILPAMAVAAYMALCSDMNNVFSFPKVLGNGSPIPSPVLGYDGRSLDWCPFLAAFLCFVHMTVPVFLQWGGSEHKMEADTAEKQELKKAILDGVVYDGSGVYAPEVPMPGNNAPQDPYQGGAPSGGSYGYPQAQPQYPAGSPDRMDPWGHGAQQFQGQQAQW